MKSFDNLRTALHSGPPHFILRAADPLALSFYNSFFKVDSLKFFASNIIDFQDLSHIAYRIYPGKHDLFFFFKIFDQDTCLLSLFCLFLLTCLLCLKLKTYGKIMIILYYLITMMFSSNIPKSLRNSCLFARFIIGSWLLFSFMQSILFCDSILDYLVKAIPNRRIDSWFDLYSRKEIEINALDVELITKFAYSSQTDMALNLRTRIKTFATQDYSNVTFLTKLIDELSTGRSAYIQNKLTLKFHLMFLQKLSNVIHHKYSTEDLHISEHGGGQEAYFILIPSSTPHQMRYDFDK